MFSNEYLDKIKKIYLRKREDPQNAVEIIYQRIMNDMFVKINLWDVGNCEDRSNTAKVLHPTEINKEFSNDIAQNYLITEIVI